MKVSQEQLDRAVACGRAVTVLTIDEIDDICYELYQRRQMDNAKENNGS